MNDLMTENRLTFAEAGETCRVHSNTVFNWAKLGVDGVTLEHYRIGGRYYTSVEAVGRFNAKLEGGDNAK